MQTKICSSKDCIHNGQPQPISNFYQCKKTKDGLSCWCKDCVRIKGKKYRDANKVKINKQKREYNKTHKKQKALTDKIYRNSLAKYDLFFERLSKYDECRQDPDNPELLQVRCKNHNCQNWFNPTNDQVHHRLTAINSINMGEANFYCSDECKNTCPLYGLRYDPHDKDVEQCTRTDNLQDELRDMVFELDNYTCQKCGRNRKDEPDLILHCHHIIPRAKELMFSADVDNCITLCEECHSLIHTLPECTYASLRRKSNK